MAPITNGLPLAKDETRELQIYSKILRLRDDIYAGTHPRLKLPSHQLPPQASPFLPVQPTSDVNVENPPPIGAQPSTGFTSLSASSSNKLQARKVFSSEIDPVLLTKSDVVVGAEIRLERTRIEDKLKEQAEQTPTISRQNRSVPAEPSFELDVADILAKAQALTIAKATSDPQKHKSTSPDDDTFYSSIDNMRSSQEGVERGSPAPAVGGEPSKDEHQRLPTVPIEVDSLYGVVRPPSAGAQPEQLHALHGTVPISHLDSERPHVSPSIHQQASQDISHTEDRPNRTNRRRSEIRDSLTGKRRLTQLETTPLPRSFVEPADGSVHSADLQMHNHSAQEQGQEPASPSPISPTSPEVRVYGHQLSPVAPQPNRVSPLAVARNPRVSQPQRNADYYLSMGRSRHGKKEGPRPKSTNSSRRGPHKRTKQVKEQRETKEQIERRKHLARLMADSPEPFIKSEPVSPTLSSAGPAAKRQKRILEYDSDIPSRHQSLQVPRQREEYIISSRYDDMPQTASTVQSPFRAELVRPRREDFEPRRVVTDQYAARPVSPYAKTYYVRPEVRPSRAYSQVIERPIYEDELYAERPMLEPQYYRESARPVHRAEYLRSGRSRSPQRMRGRVSPLPIIAPMPPPTTIARPSLGRIPREHISSQPTIIRQSAVPLERASVGPAGLHEADRGVEYIRTSNPYHVFPGERVIERVPSPAYSRRIIEQPGPLEYTSDRPREYPGQPREIYMARVPREQLVEYRTYSGERHISHFEEPITAREIPRTQSTRPLSIQATDGPGYGPRSQSIVHELPPQRYIPRSQSIRPEELPQRVYTGSVRPDTRRPPSQAQRQPSLQMERTRSEFSAPIVRPSRASGDGQELFARPTTRRELASGEYSRGFIPHGVRQGADLGRFVRETGPGELPPAYVRYDGAPYVDDHSYVRPLQGGVPEEYSQAVRPAPRTF